MSENNSETPPKGVFPEGYIALSNDGALPPSASVVMLRGGGIPAQSSQVLRRMTAVAEGARPANPPVTLQPKPPARTSTVEPKK